MAGCADRPVLIFSPGSAVQVRINGFPVIHRHGQCPTRLTTIHPWPPRLNYQDVPRRWKAAHPFMPGRPKSAGWSSV